MRVLYCVIILISLLLSSTYIHAENPNTLLTVYKSQQCGCCNKWITHMENSGFQINAHNLNAIELSEIKDNHNIHNHYQSCHTGVYKDKYVFEGHVPAKFITQFLLEKPKGAIGLAVPAMPVGTPGMEVGNKFSPYEIVLLKNDGSHEVYARIDSYEQQF